MAHRISPSDITDKIVMAFATVNDPRIDRWMTNVDNELIALALEHDVQEESISAILHPRIKEYLVSYFCLMVCRDNIGSNNVDTSIEEKYRVKYDLYKDICSEFRQGITGPMLTLGTEVTTAEDMVAGGIVWRG